MYLQAESQQSEAERRAQELFEYVPYLCCDIHVHAHVSHWSEIHIYIQYVWLLHICTVSVYPRFSFSVRLFSHYIQYIQGIVSGVNVTLDIDFIWFFYL